MNNLQKIIVLLLIPVLSNCYIEHDSGLKTPRQDPCTGFTETKYAYVFPDCPHPPPPPPDTHVILGK